MILQFFLVVKEFYQCQLGVDGRVFFVQQCSDILERLERKQSMQKLRVRSLRNSIGVLKKLKQPLITLLFYRFVLCLCSAAVETVGSFMLFCYRLREDFHIHVF
jgi:hypothetical protein